MAALLKCFKSHVTLIQKDNDCLCGILLTKRLAFESFLSPYIFYDLITDSRDTFNSWYSIGSYLYYIIYTAVIIKILEGF